MYQKNNRGLENILIEINAQREKMISCALINGFTNELTIKYSQELDVLINEYQQAPCPWQGELKFGISFQQLLISRPEEVLV